MTTLHLGVVDIPYVTSERPADARKRVGKHRRAPKKSPDSSQPQAKSTGDVAEILEDKYHIMELFYEEKQDSIVKQIEESVSGAVESLMMGAPPNINPYGAAESEVENQFKQFLSNREVEALGIPGVPTKAALAGVSHRFKHPYAKRAPRPSFIDTGLYQSSFTMWVD